MSLRPEVLEAFLKMMDAVPRQTFQVTRAVPEMGDGVIDAEAKFTGIDAGIFKTIKERRRTILSCCHIAEPAIVCRFLDEQFTQPHFACAADAHICAGCNTAGCARHLSPTDDSWLCGPCGEKARLDQVAGRVLGGLLEFWE